MATIILIAQVAEFINHQDNDGHTALDFAKKSREETILNGETPPARSQCIIDVLEIFEPRKENQELIDQIENAAN